MNWERDAELRVAQLEKEGERQRDAGVTLSFIMLKPDGNRPEVLRHIDRVFQQNRMSAPDPIQIQFTLDEAFAFYPKPVPWREKYGQKRIDALVKAKRLNLAEVSSALNMGDEILCGMAEYLSEGTCQLILFRTQNAPQFGRKMVGATIPVDAHPYTLRGSFSKDSIEHASLDRRALRNVAHAPDDENVGDELVQLSQLKCLGDVERQNLQGIIAYHFPHKAHLFTLS
jgi:nucleoside diphosphate kinase